MNSKPESPIPPVVLTIAGFDPSSGAGVTADIKTIAAQGCFGIACITALTIQSTRGVRRLEAVDKKIVAETLEELVADFELGGVHIGMLGNEKVAEAVADFLDRARPPHVVLDPILKSSSGADLLDPAGIEVLLHRLLPLAEVIAPNLAEAGILAGMDVSNLEQMREAAVRLHSRGAANVVVTGGHLDEPIDLLFERRTEHLFHGTRQLSNSTHGTGCAFSTALACQLAMGRELPEAVRLSKAYVSAAIQNGQRLGHGIGPVHHLFSLDGR